MADLNKEILNKISEMAKRQYEESVISSDANTFTFITDDNSSDKYNKPSKLEYHKMICDYIHNLYVEKNHDYGDSVHDTYTKYGLVSFLVRMEDKLNRVRTLDRISCKQQDAKVFDEKIDDTLLDLANYAILAYIELNKDEYIQ